MFLSYIGDSFFSPVFLKINKNISSGEDEKTGTKNIKSS